MRILEISAPDSAKDVIHQLAEDHQAIDWWYSAKNKDSRRTTRILIHLEEQQGFMDDLQKSLHKEKNWRLVILPVEASLPSPPDREKDPDKGKKKLQGTTITREELYGKVSKGAILDSNFFLLAVLSTIVATIGLIQNNVAVIIGAMVIAPFLGPNLALAFGAALGDKRLIHQSIQTNLAGLCLTFVITIFLGVLIPASDLDSPEIISRTLTGYDSIILALASGAAAVLSLSTGLSSALVGVMVAVALLPPAAAAGLMLGAGLWDQAFGAALLLLTNIVCVGLSAQLVFLLKGIKPRTWYMQKKSEQSTRLNLIIWGISLAMLMAIITIRLYIFT
ncbi:MAG: TIGR00341 family protein [Rhodospirillales bacterium]|nr:TIGR00341 family protein [Rhodospirillales bacterium]MCB9972990.1 TIGR00341 family protein [Rhodospirillales bacterium]MCB9980022.1 TIGR00341 family protein [Rhodospirillales bacterium]